MPCHRVTFGDGISAIVCTGRRRKDMKPCTHPGCTALGRRLCDWKMPGGKTCDRAMCVPHSFTPVRNKDLCPEHRAAYQAWLKERRPPLVLVP